MKAPGPKIGAGVGGGGWGLGLSFADLQPGKRGVAGPELQRLDYEVSRTHGAALRGTGSQASGERWSHGSGADKGRMRCAGGFTEAHGIRPGSAGPSLQSQACIGPAKAGQS